MRAFGTHWNIHVAVTHIGYDFAVICLGRPSTCVGSRQISWRTTRAFAPGILVSIGQQGSNRFVKRVAHFRPPLVYQDMNLRVQQTFFTKPRFLSSLGQIRSNE